MIMTLRLCSTSLLMMKTKINHIPVLLDEVTESLNINPSGIYIDGTLGGGGHSRAILSKLSSKGRLIAIDQDEDAINNSTICSPIFTPIHDNFNNIKSILKEFDIKSIDGMLLDLGVSSYQIDTAMRGFSYTKDGPLDMRMNKNNELTADIIINTYTQRELTNLFFTYGEEKHSRRIAKNICTEREKKPIKTTMELVNIIKNMQSAMRVFMALRIKVNNELSPLEQTIKDVVNMLEPSGRLSIITFHSLEDRIVKKTFRELAAPCSCPRDLPVCVCNKTPLVNIITKKPIVPTEDEIKTNPRASSAKLRVCSKRS